jgi:gliding motility-associated lipoprotein GldH
MKKYEDIPDGVWNQMHQPEFTVEIEDTSKALQVNLLIRNASFYPFSNLWLYIHQTDPTGAINIDTIECVLADESGKWLGDGMGDLWDNRIPWRMNYKFSNKGAYSFKIEQAMRAENLPGILDVGMSVEILEQE